MGKREAAGDDPGAWGGWGQVVLREDAGQAVTAGSGSRTRTGEGSGPSRIRKTYAVTHSRENFISPALADILVNAIADVERIRTIWDVSFSDSE